MVSPPTKPVRILRIIARLNVGGPARHVVWLTAALQEPEWSSTLIAGRVPPGEEDMSHFATANGVHPLIVPEMSREISARDVTALWKIYRMMRRLEPDIVHTHTAKAGTIGRIATLLYRWLTPAVLLGRTRQCSVVHTYHGHVFHGYYGPRKTRFFLAIERLLARLATDRIVVLSPQQKNEIHGRLGIGRADQVSIVPLGIDLSRLSGSIQRRLALRSEIGVTDRELVVGIVGRLTEIKNHELFLRAAREWKLRGSNVPVKFMIVGNGHLRGRLESLAATLDLGASVHFLGNREDALDLYAAVDIIALTSLNEGTPLSVLEAMASKVPVIATAVGGVIDLVGDPREKSDGLEVCERGVLIRRMDPLTFCKGLELLVRNPSLRQEIGERGAAFVRRNYDKGRLIRNISALYRDMLARARKS
jgi:glycosyltransferase involved in cell wall biosynthesis